MTYNLTKLGIVKKSIQNNYKFKIKNPLIKIIINHYYYLFKGPALLRGKRNFIHHTNEKIQGVPKKTPFPDF